MGWYACLAYAGRAHRRRVAQYGADDWVEAHTRASSFYEERKAEVLAELRRLGEGGPFDGDGVAGARRMIALAAAHSGPTDEGPLPATWCDLHRADLGEAARLVATCLDESCRRHEVWWTRNWTTQAHLTEMRGQRAPYLSYLCATGQPLARERLEHGLVVELEVAMLRAEAEYGATRALVHAVFAQGLPDVVADAVRTGDRFYAS